MYTYALLDINGVCTGFWDSDRKVIRNGYKEIEKRDANLLGMKWNGEEWIEIPNETTENQLIIMAAIAELYEAMGGGSNARVIY